MASGIKIANLCVGRARVLHPARSPRIQVVALSAANYNNGQYCDKKIYITYRDISAVATIVDEVRWTLLGTRRR